MPTVSITLAPSITRHSKPSLACFVAHPFGLSLGALHDQVMHRKVLEATLAQAGADHPAGTIVHLPFSWSDDLRARQLRLEAD